MVGAVVAVDGLPFLPDYSVEPLWDISPEKTARWEEDSLAIRKGNAASIPPDPPLAQSLPRLLDLVRDAANKLEDF